MVNSFHLLLSFSVFVALLVAYPVLGIVERIVEQEVRYLRHRWLMLGALILGIGIWGIQMMGILTQDTPQNIQHYMPMFASLLLSIVIAMSFLQLAIHSYMAWWLLLTGNILTSMALALMHILSMQAIRVQHIIYQMPAVGMTLLYAFIFSTLILWGLIWFIRSTSNGRWQRLSFILLIGFSIEMAHLITVVSHEIFSGNNVVSHFLGSQDSLVMLVLGGLLGLMTALAFSVMRRNTQHGETMDKSRGNLLHFATHDVLTDLPNRALLNDRMQLAIDMSKRRQSMFAVLFMDLDGFKAINDTFGHAVGDALLVAVGKRIRACIRKEDMVARIGGDEFVVLLGNLSSLEIVEHIAENILASLRQDFKINNVTLCMTSSIGIAVFPNSGESVEALLKNADAAMYEAKQKGRNTYHFFEQIMHVSAMRHLKIKEALEHIIAKQQLSLKFQAEFSMVTKKLTGVEALLCWRSPELGGVSPTEFIPVAERSGQIFVLGDWMLNEVCAQIARWDALGIPEFKVSCRVSPLQLQTDLAQRITNICQRWNVSPQRLIFDIAEVSVMKNVKKNLDIISAIQTLGIDIALDDFGAGFSSLAYLQELHCHQIKIDRLLIASLNQNETSGIAVISAIIALAHALHINVVAKGIETENQMAILQQLHCDQGQGYILGRPCAESELIPLLRGFLS